MIYVQLWYIYMFYAYTHKLIYIYIFKDIPILVSCFWLCPYSTYSILFRDFFYSKYIYIYSNTVHELSLFFAGLKLSLPPMRAKSTCQQNQMAIDEETPDCAGT